MRGGWRTIWNLFEELVRAQPHLRAGATGQLLALLLSSGHREGKERGRTYRPAERGQESYVYSWDSVLEGTTPWLAAQWLEGGLL